MRLTPELMESILDSISFPKAKFRLCKDVDSPYLQVEFDGCCNVTGEPILWKGRKWRLSPHMTKSEIVQTAFLAILIASEHEVREQFRFRGRAIFGPHFDVEHLVTLASDPRNEDTR